MHMLCYGCACIRNLGERLPDCRDAALLDSTFKQDECASGAEIWHSAAQQAASPDLPQCHKAAELKVSVLQNLYQVFHSMALLRLAPGKEVARKYKEAVAAMAVADPSTVQFMLVCPHLYPLGPTKPGKAAVLRLRLRLLVLRGCCIC